MTTNPSQDPNISNPSGVEQSRQIAKAMVTGTDPQSMEKIFAHQWIKANQDVLDYVNKLFVAAQHGQPIPKEMTQQQLLSSVKEEVAGLQKMVSTLQEGLQDSGNEKALGQLKQDQAFLKQMSQELQNTPPTVTDDQMNKLNTLLDQLNGLAKLPPSRYQTQYWEGQVKLFAQLVKTTGLLLKPIQQDEADMEAKYMGATAMENALTSLKSFFSVPNPTLNAKFFQDLQTLLTNQKYLNPTQLKQLQSYLQTVNSFVDIKVGTQTYSLEQFGVFVMLSEQIRTYLKQNPQATMQQLQAQLLDQLKKLPKGSLTKAQLKQAEAIIADLQKFFGTSPAAGNYPLFGTIEGNGYISAYTPEEFIAFNKATIQEKTATAVLDNIPDLALFNAQKDLDAFATFFKQATPTITPQFFSGLIDLEQSIPNLVPQDQTIVKTYLTNMANAVSVKVGNQNIPLPIFSVNVMLLDWMSKDLALNPDASLVQIQETLGESLKALPEGSLSTAQMVQANLVINHLPNAFGISATLPDVPVFGTTSMEDVVTLNTLPQFLTNNNVTLDIKGPTTSLQSAPLLPGASALKEDISTLEAVVQASDPQPTGDFFLAELSLEQNLQALTGGQQQIVTTYLNGVNSLLSCEVGGASYTNPQMSSFVMLVNWINTYYKPNMSVTQLQTELQDKFNSLSPGALPPVQEAETKQIIANFPSYFATVGVTPSPPLVFGTVNSSGVIQTVYRQENPFLTGNGVTFVTATPQAFLGNPPTLYKPTDLQSMEQSLKQLVDDSAQLSKLYNALEGAQTSAQIKYEASAGQSTSLQEMFKQTILDHYMPMQDKLLQNTAANLSWSNWQAQMFTTLLGEITGFSNASSIFTFNSMLTSPSTASEYPTPWHQTFGGLVYPGNASLAKSQVNNELNAANNDIASANKAITSINQYITELENGTGGTSQFNTPSMEKQKTQLIVQLKGFRTDLQTAILNLTQLRNVLESIQVTPPVTYSTGYVSGTNLSNYIYSHGGDSGLLVPNPEFEPNVQFNDHQAYTMSQQAGANPPMEVQPVKSPTTATTGFSITINPPADLPPAERQKIMQNWQSMLSKGEFAAANGVSGDPGSGLVNIAQAFNTGEQTAENQSQNQQMELQMTMTEVQEEWTIVSTSLQILNQMYMSIAKAIFSL